jgi:hypothetical protein
MRAKIRVSLIAASVALLFTSGGLITFEPSAGFDAVRLIGVVAQSSGGHDSGGEEGGGAGGHGGGPGGSGGHGGGPGASGGHGSGHDTGSEHGGEEAKGHGTRYQHRGHASGRHGAATAHEAGGDRFGGGSGLRGNGQVPEGIGRYGEGYAAQEPQTAGRFRYWGGWTLPGDPTDPYGTDPTATTYLTSTTDVIPGPGGGPSANVRKALDSEPRCEGVAPKMPAAQQLGSRNLRRLNAARGVVDSELAESGRVVSPYLMANLQEELLKPEVDAQLAGTYLGLVAKEPVTADKVKQVGNQLCVRVSDEQAQRIAAAAEQQRNAVVAAAETKSK